MDSKGYYKLLGVDEDADDKEITKAFRKASLKYHPDRQNGKSDAEKAEAEAKFKEYNEAYSVLSDPDKRREYDMGGPDMGGFNPFGGGFNPFDMFGGSPFGSPQRRQAEPGQPIHLQVKLSIEEVFKGCTKTVTYDRKLRCPVCHGDKGTGKKTCPHCNGKGMTINRQMHGSMMTQQIMPCMHCDGTGYVIEKRCTSCGGTGFRTATNTVDIKFPAGMMEDYAVQLPGEGNESVDKKGITGDLLAFAQYDFDTEKYSISGLDVTETIHIPYYDALLGLEYILEKPDHTKKKIMIPTCVKNGQTLRLYKEGIKGSNSVGDYFVKVIYEMPSELTLEDRKLLESIKVNNYKANQNK